MDERQEGAGLKAVLEQLGQGLGADARVQSVFGQPVERDGVTVIPVARVAYGLGAGMGKKLPKAGQGEVPTGGSGGGGGGGARVLPAGFIQLGNGAAEFHPIEDPRAESLRTFMTLVGLGLCTWFVLRGVRSLYGR